MAKELGEKLEAWRKEVGAKMMKPNPDYVPNPQGKDGNIDASCPALPRYQGVHVALRAVAAQEHARLLDAADDSASWEFTVTKPGKFTVEVLQGCGKGQGGSEVELSCRRTRR